jgi:hypothetical protein
MELSLNGILTINISTPDKAYIKGGSLRTTTLFSIF